MLVKILSWDALIGLIGIFILGFMVFTTPTTKSQQENAPAAILFAIVLIGYSVVKYYMAINSFSNEKEWIDKYNKNGGYLTQDEFYNSYRR